MKKTLVSIIALAALAGCAGYYDYYTGNVRYTQDGDDCIYYSTDVARHYTSDVSAIDADKKIVYKNTRCSDLYAADHANNIPLPQHKVLAPAAATNSCSACDTCNTCNTCSGKAVLKRRYVIVPAM